MRMRNRLAQLEARERGAGSGMVRVVRLYQEESQDDAVAAYEAEHGAIPDDGSLLVIVRKFLTPRPCVA